MIRLVLIGTGNVAKRLFCLWKRQDSVSVVQVIGRNRNRLSHFEGATAITSFAHMVEDADIYLLAVRDDAIRELSVQLSGTGKLIVHTSGTVALNNLSAKHRRGVFYPLQTFSNTRPHDLKNVPICIEATLTSDLKLLKQLGSSLSDCVQVVSSEKRKVLHLAAVFANNFTNHMYHISQELLDSEELPHELLQPLIEETANKLQEFNALDSQTGPARRGDEATWDQQMRLLKNPRHKDIYKLLSKSIRTTYVKKL